MNDAPRAIAAAEKLDWLRLIRSENVGPITFSQLLARFGSAQAALAALPDLARRGGARGVKICGKAAAEREMEALAALGGRLIAIGEDEYPAALAAINDAPPLLAVRGHSHLLKKHAVAVVGARNASANGKRFARNIARDLGNASFLVASGFARGIDTAAHEGSLPTGTLAVVAGGIDVVYPQENAGLFDRLIGEGVVVAEQPLGMAPRGRDFPKRNRIISGISLGVVVVEAAQRSGSLITTRFALEQGREIFAVPGSPLDPRCKGTNDLIRNGATLTESVDDILQQVQGMLRRPASERRDSAFMPFTAEISERELAPARGKVLESLGPAPVPVDEIVRQCQLSPAAVAVILLELELAGRLQRHPGHQVSRAAP